MKNQYNLSSKLRSRITIQKSYEIIDDSGGTTANWVDVIKVFAYVLPLEIPLSAEHIYTNQIITSNYYKFIMRYIPGITCKMRVVYKERFFNIQNVINELEENKILKIIAKE
ncbi:Bacteriophage head-tail adaptor [Rickettsiales bacterium Ac37b]|nr:Bacteriophage head-tail adaptor [Rickettsiales bacterium Ac37b]